MSERGYLLFIDKHPIDNDLKNYFAQFNIEIMQQDKLSPLNLSSNPLAILIHWSLIKNDLPLIAEFYINYPTPLLIIHDQADEDICIQVLDAGADDFIIAPIYPRELHARVTAINRRVLKTRQSIEQEKEVLVFTPWRLYPSSRRIFNEMNQELFLSAGEYDLLYTFVQQPQRTLDRELLLQTTKNSDLHPFDRRIDVQISRLRQKIEIDAKNPVLIKTIRNGGYMFTAPVLVLKETDLK